VFAIEARDEEGDLVTRGTTTLLLRNDGGFGGDRPPRTARHSPPDRAPDFEVHEKIPRTQALLYRLSGDTNPLHADPEFAAEAGFEEPILHGLCTFGYVGRVVLDEVCHGEPKQLAALEGQFSAPVFPGDTLVISGWRDDGRIVLRVVTEARPDEICLGNAHAELR
jgi:3-hydroxyacyl-CoA dehydrogenase/3a,7a,12a-trihydroxy-5b-cholest-24-enoyl-CoA hydratase